MGIYELVPYWEPHYLKCQAEAIQQAQLQAEAVQPLTPVVAENAFQVSGQLPELTFSVQACIPYISMSLMIIFVGIIGFLFVNKSSVKDALVTLKGEISSILKSVQVFLFFLVRVKSGNDFRH
jgi:hypothetical protein